MTLVEFAEKTSPVPISKCQKNFLAYYEQMQKGNGQMFICVPPRVGSRLRQIIRKFEKENDSMLLPPKQECMQSKRCTLTIDGEEFAATVEEHKTVEYGFNEKSKRVRFEHIHRKYYLDKPLQCLKTGIFEVIQDGTQWLKCYMSDDRMRLIEC